MKYLHNHAFDIAFEVIDEHEEWAEVPDDVILEALKARVADLEADITMVEECTSCFDTFSFHGDLEEERADRYNNYSRAEIKKNRRVGSDFLEERIRNQAPQLYDACKEFVRKVECGEARSKRSYGQMKEIIDLVERTSS